MQQDVMDAVLGNDPNHASAILALRLSGFRALLGADLSLDGWSILWDRWKDERPEMLKADLLVYSHHGGDIRKRTRAWLNQPPPDLTDLQLLEAIAPSIVLISTGTSQPGGYAHPRRETFELLAHYREQCASDGRTFHLACTELTRRCHPAPATLRSEALQILGKEKIDLVFANDHLAACPCAATISLSISPDGGRFEFLPNAAHQEFVELVQATKGTPGCRLPAP